MARQSRFIEPINATFEELAKAVVSPLPKEKEEILTSDYEKETSKNCDTSIEHGDKNSSER